MEKPFACLGRMEKSSSQPSQAHREPEAAAAVVVGVEAAVVEAHVVREVAIVVRRGPVEAVAPNIADRSPVTEACAGIHPPVCLHDLDQSCVLMLRVTHQPIGYSDGQYGVVSELAAFIEQLEICSLNSAVVAFKS